MLQERASSIFTRRTVQFVRSAFRLFGFIRRFYEKQRVPISISGAALLFLIIYLAPASVIFVDAGKAGVIYEAFGRGTRTDAIYTEGVHIIWPWDKMTIYDVRINETSTRFTIISANGLDIAMTLSIRFFPRIEHLGLLHKQVGPDYADKIVVPEVQAIVRNLCAKYESEEIYRTQPYLDESIRVEVSRHLDERFIVLDAVLIKLIELPESVKTAIQSKLVAKVAAEEMKFKIEREEGEKQRKVIEAEGIEAFNATIRRSLSEEVLRYKGIEALLETARSAKSNTLIFGAPESFRYLLDLGSGRGPKGPADLGSALPP